jgi:hypothetical protein
MSPRICTVLCDPFMVDADTMITITPLKNEISSRNSFRFDLVINVSRANVEGIRAAGSENLESGSFYRVQGRGRALFPLFIFDQALGQNPNR